MRLGVTLSIGLHTLVILITWFGFPHLRREPPVLDDIIFVKELPHGATGKLQKVELRDEYKDHLMEK